jgi:glyoxylase-like metal-dependent hydrolase (beta-lactamase superfamily II)
MSEWQTIEVAPGITRIESILGPRPFSQYLVRGERTLLVDTGIVATPGGVILPALESLGLAVADLDFVVVSHADVDHFGGNAALREAAPQAVFMAHEADVPWIESSERILRERYGWYAAHGVDYDAETFAWLRDAMGPDSPVDVRLAGGETIRLGPELSLRVLHLPGHSPGHIGLWERRSATAIVTDAVMASGLLDLEGNVIHPPPYFDVPGYVGSARLLQELGPARLLTAHYDVIEGDAVARFLDATIAFVERVAAEVRLALESEGNLTLETLLARADPVLGPFTSMPNELAGPLRAHLRELVCAGLAVESPTGLAWSWRGY